MPISSVAEFVEAIRQNRLLEMDQLDTLGRDLLPRFRDPRLLAKQLIQQSWLTPFQINQIFQGRAGGLVLGSYVILERIGEGGMGQVFKARHQKLGRVVALKVIRREHLANADAIKRFRREIQVVAQLDHPNIVRAYDADQVGDMHFFVMEFVEGTNLSALLKQSAPPPLPIACEYIKQVASGLQQAFERGMVHRDIKPANLLVTKPTDAKSSSPWGPTIKILDMGVARLQQMDDDSISALTKEGRVVGTPDYMAPEQAVNSAKADIRADLYSLGCTFYFLLTGHGPFSGGTPMEKLLKHRIDTAKPVEQLRPGIPPAVAGIVRKLMAKKAEERFQTPADLVNTLNALNLKAAAPQVPLAVAMPVSRSSGTAIPVAQAVPVGASIPQAVPMRAGAAQTGLPVATRSDEFQFEQGPPSRTGSSSSASSRKKLSQPVQVNWKVVIIAAIAILLGLIFLIVAIVFGNPRRSGRAAAPDSTTLLLRDLLAQPADTPAEAEVVRRDLLRFRLEHPGTSEALAAGRESMRLPSLLDHLKAAQVPQRERRDLPSEVVAVLGERRQHHWGAVRTLAFSPDGNFLASGGEDNLVRVWNVVNMQEHAILSGHKAAVSWLAFADNQALASAGVDGTLCIWDGVNTRQPRPRLDPLPLAKGMVTAAFAADGQTLAYVSSESRFVVVLDLHGLKQGGKPRVRATLAPSGAVLSLAFQPNAPLLATAGDDKTISLWDLKPAQPKLLKALQGHDGAITALCFSRDGRRLASASPGDATMRLWNPAPAIVPEPIVFREHAHQVKALAFSPDGKLLVSAGADRSTRLWNLTGQQPGESIPLLYRPTHWIGALAFAGNSRLLATGGEDTTVRLWDVSGNEPAEQYPLHNGAMVSAVAFSPYGALLAEANDGDHVIRLWDLARDRGVELSGRSGLGYRLAFSTDGRYLASASSQDPTVQLWDLGPGEPRPPLTLPQSQRALALAFSPDSKLLAVGSADSTVHLWSVAGPRPTESVQLAGHRKPVVALAFSPDGGTLASAAEDKTVRLWSLATGKELHCLSDQDVQTLTFSPDGKVLATGGRDRSQHGEIRFWEVQGSSLPREKQLVLKKGHSRPVTQVLWSLDGESLYSAGEDGQVISHGPSTGEALQMWRFPGAVRGLALAADGRHLATANSNGTVYVLRVRTAG